MSAPDFLLVRYLVSYSSAVVVILLVSTDLMSVCAKLLLNLLLPCSRDREQEQELYNYCGMQTLQRAQMI